MSNMRPRDNYNNSYIGQDYSNAQRIGVGQENSMMIPYS